LRLRKGGRGFSDSFREYFNEKRIKESFEHFKIKLFLEKAENSILIAKHIKEI
jgi:hypothetical protein